MQIQVHLREQDRIYLLTLQRKGAMILKFNGIGSLLTHHTQLLRFRINEDIDVSA